MLTWTVSTLTLSQLVISLLVGFVLALILGWHFTKFGSTLTNRTMMRQSFVIVTLSIILIIGVVKSSIALALGLVGALSIVRFRTPIREPEEIIYLMLCVAVGLCLGAGEWLIAIVVVPVILLLMAVVKWVRRSKRPTGSLLVLHGEMNETVDALLSQYVHLCERVQTQQDRVLFRVRLKKVKPLLELIDRLHQEFPDVGVSFCHEN